MFHLISVVYKVFKSVIFPPPELILGYLSAEKKAFAKSDYRLLDPVCSPHSFRSPRLVNIAFEETVWG